MPESAPQTSALKVTNVVEHLISPLPISNPCLPADTTTISLVPAALWPIDSIPSAHQFPSELDFPRFVDAVKMVSSLWPTVAGRYEKARRSAREDEWNFSIRLTASPVPVFTQTLNAAEPFPTRNVVQPTVAPYVISLPSSYIHPNSDTPLLILCLTTLLPSRSQVLGISWAHILGDASAAGHFARLLSHFYEKPDTPPTIELIPTFFPHVTYPEYPPSEGTLREFAHDPYDGYELAEAEKLYDAAGGMKNEVIYLTMKTGEIRAMKSECEFKEGELLSSQDVLSAWWTVLLERCGCLDGRAKRMVYTVNYRALQPHHPAFPPNLSTLASNVAAMRSFALPLDTKGTTPATNDSKPSADQSDIVRITMLARAIRAELARMRNDPDYTLRWLSSAAYRNEQACIKLQGQVVVSPRDTVLVNSNLRFDWNIPFGFPRHQTAYYTPYSLLRRLMVHQANPDPGVDPRGCKVEPETELSFNVENDEMRRKIESAVELDRKRWGGVIE